jgi:tRNA(fMet)-specific endonuclease VapC
MRGEPEVVRLVEGLPEVFLNAVVVGELLAGFERGSLASQDRAELASFLELPGVSVLTVDAETAERYAVIFAGLRSRGTMIPTNDIWIAASAMQHGLPVVTTDMHFDAIPQIIVRRLRAPE